MKLSELMATHTPSSTFEGFVTNDDFVLAIDCSAEGSAEIKDYAVAQLGVTGLDANLNPITQDKTYIRAGQSTMKTGEPLRSPAIAISAMTSRTLPSPMPSCTALALRSFASTSISAC